MKILNFGSLNIDHTYRVGAFVKGGETISAEELTENIGGKGLNQSVALARAGAKVFHAGQIGPDGEMLIDFLKENNVDTGNIKISDVPTGHAIIQIDSRGQNCIIIYGGANTAISREHINGVLDKFENGDLVLLQNEINDIAYIAKKAHEKGMTVALNPSPVTGLSIPFDTVDIFILNEHEGEALFGEKDVDKLLRAMTTKYPDKIFILTLGEKGAVYASGENIIKAPAKKADAVDTTAAGDTFTGYFLVSYLSGKSPEESLRIAAAASAVTVSRLGAAKTIPFKDEVIL